MRAGQAIGMVVVAALLAGCDRAPPARAGGGAVAGELPAVARAPVLEEDAGTLQARADEALRERRLFAPAGDNAFEHFLVLRQEYGRAQVAGPALVQLQPYLTLGIERALEAAQPDEAERLLRLMARADAQAAALPRLQGSLDALRARLQAERAAVAAREAGQAAALALAVPSAPAAAPATSPASAARTAVTAPPPAPVPVPQRVPAPVAAPAPVVASEPLRPAAVATPRLLVDQAPRYPDLALARRLEGHVELVFSVGPDGRVDDVRLLDSEPAGLFDASAKAVARRWRFEATGQQHEVRRVLTYRLPVSARG